MVHQVCSRIGFKQVAKIINMWILKVFYKVHIWLIAKFG
jgi:hypothetical protein